MGRYIKSLYFVDEKEFKDADEPTTFKKRKTSIKRLRGTGLHNYKTIQFSFIDRFAFIKQFCRKSSTPKENYMTRHQITFQKGKEKFNQEFNIF